MKMIGLLGGMSWESSAEYYRLANELVRERLGGTHSARILLDSVDFAEVEALQSAGQWDEAGVLLASRAHALQKGGAEFIALCTNTMHKVISQIEEAVEVPVLHIADAVAQRVLEQGMSTVGLLGTAFTMEQDFYRERLRSHGIATLIPEEADRRVVHGVIFDELVQGIVSDSSRDAFRAIMARLVAEGAEGIILGCTEIELLVSAADATVPVFPSTRIHVEALIETALGTS